jgi:opacity protein-like surface antigen
MKKILFVAVMLLGLAGFAYADNVVSIDWYSVNIVNNSGDHLVTVIPTTTVRPDVDKLIGYSAIPMTNGNTETYITVYDGTDKSLSGECLGESEVASGGVDQHFEMRPKRISLGIVVDQGAYTNVQVYFIRE